MLSISPFAFIRSHGRRRCSHDWRRAHSAADCSRVIGRRSVATSLVCRSSYALRISARVKLTPGRHGTCGASRLACTMRRRSTPTKKAGARGGSALARLRRKRDIRTEHRAVHRKECDPGRTHAMTLTHFPRGHRAVACILLLAARRSTERAAATHDIREARHPMQPRLHASQMSRIRPSEAMPLDLRHRRKKKGPDMKRR